MASGLMATSADDGPQDTRNLSSKLIQGFHQRGTKGLSREQVEKLQSIGFTRGLVHLLAKNLTALPLRIWVVDNSGSMTAHDGSRLEKTPKKDGLRMVTCTRWRELQETVSFHAKMAALLRAPTTFRLLNKPGLFATSNEFGVADKEEEDIPKDLEDTRAILENLMPKGATPLAAHVRQICEEVKLLVPTLQSLADRSPGVPPPKVTVVIATDGLPTLDDTAGCDDASREEFREALLALAQLPVWIVFRLCTNDSSVVDYYNNIDAEAEMSVEVLDDFVTEAREVHRHNPWLTYALPLHRCREMGLYHRLFDILDERPLTTAEFQEFCTLLLGGRLADAPDAAVKFGSFVRILQETLSKENVPWNPIKKKPVPWIDLKVANKVYGGGSCALM